MKKMLRVLLSPFSMFGRVINNRLIRPILTPQDRGKVWRMFFITIIIALVAGTVVSSQYYNQAIDLINENTGSNFSKMKERPFHLGLDLQGGTHLVYEADMSNIEEDQRDDSLEGVRGVIERRVNFFGVSEPLVQTNKTDGKYRVIVELAGVKDVNEAIKMIGETPFLEFKEQAKPVELTDEEKKSAQDFNAEQKKKAENILSKLKNGGDFAKLANEFSEDSMSKDKSGDLGFVGSYSPFPALYQKAKEQGANKLVSEIVQDQKGYNIIKIGQQREDVDGDGVVKKEVLARHLLICWKESEGCTNEITKEEAKTKIDQLKQQATTSNFEQLVKDNSTEPGAGERGGSLGWFGRGSMVKDFEDVAFATAVGTISDVVETQFGYHLIYKEDEKPLYQYELARILLKTKSEEAVASNDPWATTGLTGKQLERAQVVFDGQTNQPQVSLKFNQEGADLFAQITERNIDKPVAIFLDNNPISIPTVNDVIRDGAAVINGNFGIKEAKELSQRLNSGALPVPINLLSQQTVGATLGKESVDQSLKAGIVGLIAVALFMLLIYRLPGLLADLALIVYCLIVLAIFKLWPVTLTLSGVAGFILSIGIAVDANVLTFERIKEELRSGKPLRTSIEDGFKRSWLSIRDGNASTLITCFILFEFGTSMIKGFAVTLAIGILTSLFSAIVITRVLLRLVSSWVAKHKWLFGVK